MKISFSSRRPIFSLALAACLFLGPVVGPMAVPTMLPDAEAAPSREKRKLKKLKKKSRRLKRQVRRFAGLLAAARRPVPRPAPFIEMVKVGNVGNATDAGNTSDPDVYGAVPYEFSIGKYEVTLAQYTAFLNAVAPTDTYGLYNGDMATDGNIAGIERSGSDGSYTYAVIGSGDRPVTYVSWFDAARFCNWLHNGRPTGEQDETTTERGAYTLDGATSGVGFERVWAANYWIPSEDEWYKAAYHQPQGQGGDGDDYWLYPTGSDTAPTAEAPPGGSNSANFSGGPGTLTEAGAYTGSGSFYGTFDQGGNVWEWNDAVIGSSSRGVRGGSWFYVDSENVLRSFNRYPDNPGNESYRTGFRVASP